MTGSILKVVQRRLTELPRGLREHTQRVEEVSGELAQAHDLCRAMGGEDLLGRARELGISVHPVEERMPLLLHGPVAAEMMRREGLEDVGVYQGIYYHSTASPGLEPVAKVVFLADKLDPPKIKRYSYLPELKAMALQNLDRALLEFLTREMASYLKGGYLIHPASVEARNELLLERPLALRLDGFHTLIA